MPSLRAVIQSVARESPLMATVPGVMIISAASDSRTAVGAARRRFRQRLAQSAAVLMGAQRAITSRWSSTPGDQKLRGIEWIPR